MLKSVPAQMLSASRMGSAAVLIGSLLCLAAGAGMAAPDAADQQAIERVIRSQLAAFQQDDPAIAFSLASPGIQARFRTADIFLYMVKAGYPAVYRPRDVRFLELSELEGQPVQQVYLIGPDGKPYIAHYPMLRLEDGTWRIDGCVVTPVQAKSA